MIAPELVRIEMLRIGRIYELLLTRLSLNMVEGRARPVFDTAPLIRGHQGKVPALPERRVA